MKRRTQAGWMDWRKMSGVLCYRKLSARVKGKMFKSVVRPAMLYGMETVAVTEKQMENMEVTELKMVRWALGSDKKGQDKKRVREGDGKDCKVGETNSGVRGSAGTGHVRRREGYVGRRMLSARQKKKRKAKEKVGWT